MADDNDVTVMLREALKSAHGGDRSNPKGKDNNIILANANESVQDRSATQGTSKAYTLDRLTREAPELREKVDAGELSASAAAVLAGFQPKRFTVVATTPKSIAKTLRKQLPDDVLEALIAELKGNEQ